MNEVQEQVTQVTPTESTGTEGTVETTQIVILDEDRPFLSTSLDEYTVSEGLLLLILVLLVVSKIGQAIKEGFYWLL